MPNPTIGIVGINGVGAAHAIAALKLGWTIRWVVDIDPYKPEVLGPGVIANSWGDFSEHANFDYDIPVYRKLDQASHLPVDVIVIATPDEAHNLNVMDAVAFYPDSTILCEKPYKSKVEHPNVFISAEWIYHPRWRESRHIPLQTLGMWHNNHSNELRKWAYPIKGDLLSHLMFLAYDHFGSVPKLVRWDVEGEMVVAGEFRVREGGVWHPLKLGAIYNPEQQNIKHMFGFPIDVPAIEIAVNDDLGMCWYEPLFQDQLKAVLLREHPITSSIGVLTDQVLEG